MKRIFAFITHLLIFIPGADLLKLTRDDVIQICGPADGIRLFNALKGRYVISVNISVGSDSKWIWIFFDTRW